MHRYRLIGTIGAAVIVAVAATIVSDIARGGSSFREPSYAGYKWRVVTVQRRHSEFNVASDDLWFAFSTNLVLVTDDSQVQNRFSWRPLRGGGFVAYHVGFSESAEGFYSLAVSRASDAMEEVETSTAVRATRTGNQLTLFADGWSLTCRIVGSFTATA